MIMNNKPSFTEALKFWIKLGFISFGGPAGQISIMHSYLVDKKKWISESKFLHALNYCMLLPGPEAQQLATYMGWLLHGKLGGFLAGIFFVLPSMFILLALSIIYVQLGNIPWIYALFNGLKPAVIAIVVLALLKIGKKSLKSKLHYFIAFGAFVCIFWLNIPFPIIILSAILIAGLSKKIFPTLFSISEIKNEQKNENESEYFINKNTILPHVGFNPKRFWKSVFIAILLWFLPFVLFYFFTSDFKFWKQLSLFFSKAALVTFGGAYAVLPYVAQVSVEKLNWLTNLQMMDGLALGETTPGPLIMVLVFVGFMAGYNHFSSISMGALGLVTTTFFTFLPCFLFIFIGAPIIERTQENKTIQQILSIVSAAVVGVILNLSIYLGKVVIFPNNFIWSEISYLNLFWIVLSFIFLHKFKVGMLKWILISAIFGLVSFWIIK
jgi:chromate transporter